MARRLPIAAKFFLTHLVIAGIALFIAGAAGFFLVRSLVMADADENLLARARIVAETFRPLLADPDPMRDQIAREGDRIGKEIGGRITVVLPDGTVVADSAVGAAGIRGMENHALHPEIRDALSGTTGISHRRSITVREEQRYAALPIAVGGGIRTPAAAAEKVRAGASIVVVGNHFEEPGRARELPAFAAAVHGALSGDAIRV